MVNIDSAYITIDQLNKQVVGWYDGITDRLNSQLYRVSGLDLQLYKRPSVYLEDLNGNSTFPAYADEVLTYEDLVYMYDSTKRLFEQSEDIFTGCFRKSIIPLKRDLDTLEKLIAQYDKLGLIIEEEDHVCVNTEE